MTSDMYSTTKLCPTCSTRVSLSATRCLVCGCELNQNALAPAPKPIQRSHMAGFTLSLPAAIGIMTLMITAGVLLIFFLTQKTDKSIAGVSTSDLTATLTPTSLYTATTTLTPTIMATFTPLPTVSYTVKLGDSCIAIAIKFKVSTDSIVFANNLDATCSLREGQKLVIPQPAPTASPQALATSNGQQATDTGCATTTYTIQASDTLNGIAASFNVTPASLRDANSLSGDAVKEGQVLLIPLCHQAPTTGPSPTATPPPPYAAPNLLLPADGAQILNANDGVTLQWASVGTLLKNEAYEVVVEDVTDPKGKKLVDYVTDTKYILPTNFRPTDNVPHIIRWSVQTVRQTGTDGAGKPVYSAAGAASVQRVFNW